MLLSDVLGSLEEDGYDLNELARILGEEDNLSLEKIRFYMSGFYPTMTYSLIQDWADLIWEAFLVDSVTTGITILRSVTDIVNLTSLLNKVMLCTFECGKVLDKEEFIAFIKGVED